MEDWRFEQIKQSFLTGLSLVKSVDLEAKFSKKPGDAISVSVLAIDRFRCKTHEEVTSLITKALSIAPNERNSFGIFDGHHTVEVSIWGEKDEFSVCAESWVEMDFSQPGGGIKLTDVPDIGRAAGVRVADVLVKIRRAFLRLA